MQTLLGNTMEGLAILAEIGDIQFVDAQKKKLKEIYDKSKQVKKYDDVIKYMTPEEQYEFLKLL